MKILIIHNRYQETGGEDAVVAREIALLRRHGHEIVEYIRTNSEVRGASISRRLQVPLDTIWSRRSYAEISEIITTARPQVAHIHNTHFVISQAAYYACRRQRVPVVQTLHNPRMLCPAGTCLYEGRLCEACNGRLFAWPGVVRACYRNSRSATAMVAASATVHRLIGTSHVVDRYIASTDTYRGKFIAAGLPADRVVVKPHFVEPDPGARDPAGGSYALYAGRLAGYKGVNTLLRAWREHLQDIPLVIRGDGPLRADAAQAATTLASVRYIGEALDEAALFQLIKGARLLIWPSEGFYETFGLIAAEAFACGVPVIASKAGVAVEMVTNNRNGLHFESGNPADLAQKVRWAWNSPDWLISASLAARQEFLQRFQSERNYDALMRIYSELLNEKSEFQLRKQAV